MSDSICGADCAQCPVKDGCRGCRETEGRPFGGECMVAACCRAKGHAQCGGCTDAPCGLREELCGEFNGLGIADMEKVTELNALKGSFINLAYPLPNGKTVTFLDDDKIYLGCQLPRGEGNRCYGLAADEKFLLVCEYGEGGSDPEIVLLKRRK